MGNDQSSNTPFEAPITRLEKRRIDLQETFEKILESKHVYFEAPESIKLSYPCILYSRTSGMTEFANNYPYKFDYRYTVTVMDLDPDSRIPEKLARLQSCTFDRGYVTDDVYHWVYTIY